MCMLFSGTGKQSSYWPVGPSAQRPPFHPSRNHWQKVNICGEKLHLVQLFEALPSEPQLKTPLPDLLNSVTRFPLFTSCFTQVQITPKCPQALFSLIGNTLSFFLSVSLMITGAARGGILAVTKDKPLAGAGAGGGGRGGGEGLSVVCSTCCCFVRIIWWEFSWVALVHSWSTGGGS